MKKIFEIGTGYTPIPARSGAATEIVVEELTRALLQSGRDAEIIDIASASRDETDLPIREVKVPAGISGADVQLGLRHKIKRVVYSVMLAGTLRKILREETDCAVLHFHNQYNMFFFLLLTPRRLYRNCLLAYTNHSYIWHGSWREIAGTVRKRYFQEIYCMRHAERVYVLNKRTAVTLKKHIRIPADRIVPIDNGVNTSVYRPEEPEKIRKIKEDLGLDGKTVFLQVGSVCDRKNQLGAVRLLAPILRKEKNAVFLYAGGVISDEYQSSLEQYAEAEGLGDQVRYLGELHPGETLNRLYNAADVMVFPSKAEGFSLVILESMAAGTPVLVPDSLHFRLEKECLRYSDAEEFSDLVEKRILQREGYDLLCRNGRKAVEDHFSWNKVAEDYARSWEG